MATVSSSATPASPRIALFLLLAGAVALGGSGIWVKLSELGPTATAFYRMAFAVPVFCLWSRLAARRRGRADGPRGRRDAVIMALAGLFFAGDILTWHWALTLTTVADATLLGNLAPFFVTGTLWLAFGERPRPLFLAGLALAFGGAAVLMGVSLDLDRARFLGDALCLATAAFYAAYLMAVAQLRRRHGTAAIMAWSTAATALVVLMATLAVGETLVAATATGWLVLAGLAFVSQAGGQGLVAHALAHLPTAFSSAVLLLQPVAAAAFAWLILGEALSPLQAAGGAAVLAGIALARRGSDVG